MGVFKKKWIRKLGKGKNWLKHLGLNPKSYTEGNPLKNWEDAFKERHSLTHSPLQDKAVSNIVQGGLLVFGGPIGAAVGSGLDYSRSYLDAKDAEELAREQAAGYTYYGGGGMDQVYQAAELIQRIEAQGGPPLEDVSRFYAVKRMVNQALAQSSDDLGAIFTIPVLLGVGAVSFLSWILYKQGDQINKATGKVIRAGERASRVVVWAGAAWVLYQLFKRR